MTEPTREPWLALRRHLADHFFEREGVIEGLLCALLARRSVLLVGPPGTGKSGLVEALARPIEGARFFEWALSRGTTPEELFGPLSLEAYGRGELRRLSEGMLPEAHIICLDEVFEASSPIANPLRRLLDSGSPELFVATAAETPQDGARSGLLDRFALRYQLLPLKQEYPFLRMLGDRGEGPKGATPPVLTFERLHQARQQISHVQIPGGIRRSLFEIRTLIFARGIEASDRRFRQALALLQARAFLEGRKRCGAEDLALMGALLWNEPGEIAEVEEAVRTVMHEHESDEGGGPAGDRQTH